MPIRPENQKRYPENWAEISLRIRGDRAQWRCECAGECGRPVCGPDRCSARHMQPVPAGTGKLVILTTAHLNHTPEDCSDGNLRAMCQACHLSYDKDHHAQTRAATIFARQMGQYDGDLFTEAES